MTRLPELEAFHSKTTGFPLQPLPTVFVQPHERKVDKDPISIIAHDATIAKIIFYLFQLILELSFAVGRVLINFLLKLFTKFKVFWKYRLLN